VTPSQIRPIIASSTNPGTKNPDARVIAATAALGEAARELTRGES
jgi:hypothetical protein